MPRIAKLAVLLFVCSGTARGQATLVNNCIGQNAGVANVSCTLTLGANHIVLASTAAYGDQFPSPPPNVPTDTLGLVWGQTAWEQHQFSTFRSKLAIDCSPTGAGGADTITFNSPATAINPGGIVMIIQEYSGLSTCAVAGFSGNGSDVNAGTAVGTTVSTTSFSTFASNTLIVGFATFASTTITAGSGYTLRTSIVNTAPCCTGATYSNEDNTTNSPGSFVASWGGLSAGVTNWEAVATAFGAAGITTPVHSAIISFKPKHYRIPWIVRREKLRIVTT